VVIWAWNSKEAGCLSTLNRCSLRFLRTLLTWDLASVGGRLAVRKEAGALYCGQISGGPASLHSQHQTWAAVLQSCPREFPGPFFKLRFKTLERPPQC
jgi:hypothetical protein